jgi:hypothetical protein
MPQIKYKSGYKYQLVEDHVELLSKEFVGGILDKVETDYIVLTDDAWLAIKKGYAWDGPSGPTIDTKNFMRGSLVHDALYQLIRSSKLPYDYKILADRELKRICLQDGMSKLRAWYVYIGVKDFGKLACLPSNEKAILIAP